jgi:hypothetical protein
MHRICISPPVSSVSSSRVQTKVQAFKDLFGLLSLIPLPLPAFVGPFKAAYLIYLLFVVR